MVNAALVLIAVKVVLVLRLPLARATLPSKTVPVLLEITVALVVLSNTLSETLPLVVIVTLALLITALLVPTRVESPPTKV